MIVEGLFMAAVMGFIAYGSAEKAKERRMFLDWAFETIIVVAVVVGMSFAVDFRSMFQRPSEHSITIVLAFVAVFIGAVLGRWIGRRMMSLNLPPAGLGLVFFVGTFVLWNIVALYFYLKEPT